MHFVVALSIACFAASALAFASSLASAFLPAVKSLFASISLILSANATSTFLATGLATGVRSPDLLMLLRHFATCSTAVFVVALLMACFAASA